ncbi:cardiolipin synthase [Ammoniphilus sp. CFH 90114]|uniref:cardiolipin synthase n=1 Tax=Ammoniphilus sp. CFH 90114 TaxID=2493665 RepID=UPI001F0C0EAC|nr:cardiolipin synthase [Ammoniphilus sp. CFH 90114]
MEAIPFLSEHFALFLVIPFINFLLAIGIIFLERKSISSTWVWLMLLLLIPILGFVLYLFFGRNMARKKVYKLNNQCMKELHKKIQQQAEEINQGLLKQSEILSKYDALIYMNLVSGESVLTLDNEVTVYTTGEEKFYALFEQIKQANHHVHLLYYLFRDDDLGRKVLEVLTEKAQEGIEVRVMYDHVGSKGLSLHFFEPLIRAGGKVIPFFPSKIPYLNHRINYRNHRKIAIVDGIVGFVGGYNIGDEYLGLNPKIGAWRDTHIKVTGSSVGWLQAQFLLDWNVASKDLMTFQPEFFPEVRSSTGNTPIQMVSSGPHSEREELKNAHLKLFYEAKRSIFIQTPYFVPDESVLHALRIAAFSGIDVRIMVPKKPDSWFVEWAAHAYIGELLQAGAKFYLYEKGFLHAKTVVVDGEVACVGTTNMDNRSFKLNFEISAFLYDKNLGRQLYEIFQQDAGHTTQLTFEDYQQRGWSAKMKETLARLLAPLL